MNTIIMLQWTLLQEKFKRLEKLAPVSLLRSKDWFQCSFLRSTGTRFAQLKSISRRHVSCDG